MLLIVWSAHKIYASAKKALRNCIGWWERKDCTWLTLVEEERALKQTSSKLHLLGFYSFENAIMENTNTRPTFVKNIWLSKKNSIHQLKSLIEFRAYLSLKNTFPERRGLGR